MATKIRRSFTDEFKREAVSLLTSSGRPLTQVARELGIQPSMLRHWRDDQQTNGTVTRTARSPSSDSMSAEHAEIWRLEKELARAQMERDILKRMARPVRKRFRQSDLNSLRQRIRPVGMTRAKMEIRAFRSS